MRPNPNLSGRQGSRGRSPSWEGPPCWGIDFGARKQAGVAGHARRSKKKQPKKGK